MKKKNLIIIICIVTILVIIGIILSTKLTKNPIELGSKLTDAEKFKKEYEDLNDEVVKESQKYPQVSISSNNIIKYSNIDEIIDILENGKDAVVYFGYPTCLYCRSAIQVLLDTAETTKLDVIHYINLEDVWEVKELDPNNKVITTKKANNRYYELLSLLGDNVVEDYILKDEDGQQIETGVKTITPSLVVFITDGVVTSHNKKTVFSHDNPMSELDKEQKNGLSGIYSSGIHDVVDSKTIKGLISE